MDVNAVIEGITGWMATPQGQMYMAIAAGALVSGAMSTAYELKRNKTIPLAFSEREQMHKDAEHSNYKVGTLAEFLTTTNDLCMQVFEAYNDSNAKGGNGAFAKEIAQRNSRTLNGDGLAELVEASQGYGKALRNELGEYFAVQKSLSDIINTLDACWDESHTDYYRTEFYTDTETYTDSNGHMQTRTVTKTRQVYDHTTHEYWYNVENGRLAAKQFGEMFSQIPGLKWNEKIAPASLVSQGGKDAINKSRGLKESLPDEEYLKISRIWVDGTTKDDDLENVPGQYSDLKGLAKEWDSIKETPNEYYCYDTYSSSDDGPEGYRAVGNNRSVAYHIYSGIESLDKCVSLVLDKAPKIKDALHQLQYGAMPAIEGYVTPETKNAQKSMKALEKQVMNDTKELYSSIFDQGIDVDRIKEWRIGLFGLLGGLLTFGGWKLVEYLTQAPGGILERY